VVGLAAASCLKYWGSHHRLIVDGLSREAACTLRKDARRRPRFPKLPAVLKTADLASSNVRSRLLSIGSSRCESVDMRQGPSSFTMLAVVLAVRTAR